jgi:hypothetical protein
MHHIWRRMFAIIDRIDAFLHRWSALPVPWFFMMPVIVAGAYWFGLRSFAFTDESAVRIPALPKVFFDQTMYLQVMAKDLLHGFSILPPIMRPFIWSARAVFPAVSLSEFYVIGIIFSAVLSLWVFAALVRQMTRQTAPFTRLAAVSAFLMAHALLALRPGGPSWYVPCFLVACLFVWMGEQAFDRRRVFHGIGAWVFAAWLASAYPWYFASIIALCGLLGVYRFMRARHVLPLLSIGLALAWTAVAFRDRIVEAVLSSYAVLLAYYGGVQFSHITTISNTILLMVGWIMMWLPHAARSAREHGSRASASVFFLAAWSGQLVLWFQSVITGLSLVPDHFIYSVWLLSALSWMCWVRPEQMSTHDRRITNGICAVASLYVLWIVVRLVLGLFIWTSYPSLVIHVASWAFLALATLPIRRERMMQMALALGVASTAVGMMAVRTSAMSRAQVDGEVDGIRRWMTQMPAATNTRWCADAWTADYLFSVTGQKVYPTFSEKHDPVSIQALQNRLVEVAKFYNPRTGGDLYIWDDMILHDLDFPCRVFQPGIRLVDALPIPSSAKRFLTGCDQSWADAVRARVVARIDDAATQPVPASSALCDRFVVRKSLQHAWRIPSSAELLYEDVTAAVYRLP